MRTRTRFPLLAAAGAFLLLALAGVRPAAAGDLYVDASATGANNGSSWADAYTDLQSALAAAVSGDTIHVAAGTYKPTAVSNPAYPKSATFQLKNGVTLLGGYPSGGGTRDPAANETILSGDIGAAGDDSDNAYQVVIGSGTDSTAVLDGFTIRDGRAVMNPRLGPREFGYGGGMYIVNGSPTVRNVVFSNNTALMSGGGCTASTVAPLSPRSRLPTTTPMGMGGGCTAGTVAPLSPRSRLPTTRPTRGGAACWRVGLCADPDERYVQR